MNAGVHGVDIKAKVETIVCESLLFWIERRSLFFLKSWLVAYLKYGSEANENARGNALNPRSTRLIAANGNVQYARQQ
jgi:hypothetical protein